MTVPALRLAAACLAIAAVLGATACAPTPESAATAVPTVELTATPSPTPTEEALVVGPGAKPPRVFNGDCDAMLTAAQVSAIVGQTVVSEGPVALHRPATTLGALSCGWHGSSVPLRIATLPAAALAGAALMADAGMGYYFEGACEWYCDWLSDGHDLVVMGHLDRHANVIDRERADALGAQLAAAVRSNSVAAPGVEWVADRSGWWAPVDCTALSAETSSRLGSLLEIIQYGYNDAPAVWVEVGDSVTQASMCADPTAGAFTFTIEPGAAWAITEPGMMPVDIAVDGWTASRQLSTEHGDYLLASDGVNLLSLWVYDDAGFDRGELAVALIHALVAEQGSSTGAAG